MVEKDKGQKLLSLTNEVKEILDEEPYGTQSLLVDNLLREFYGLEKYKWREMMEKRIERRH